jgi:hypothetical protein
MAISPRTARSIFTAPKGSVLWTRDGSVRQTIAAVKSATTLIVLNNDHQLRDSMLRMPSRIAAVRDSIDEAANAACSETSLDSGIATIVAMNSYLLSVLSLGPESSIVHISGGFDRLDVPLFSYRIAVPPYRVEFES